jgi:transposase-like protein
MTVVDGAPGLIKAVEELWPDSDRQRCTVHRLRNLIAKLPKKQELHNRVRNAYWSALDQAGSAADGEARLRALVGELETDYPVRRPVSPKTCRRSASTSVTRSGCASDCAAPTCSSARWVKSNAGPK